MIGMMEEGGIVLVAGACGRTLCLESEGRGCRYVVCGAQMSAEERADGPMRFRRSMLGLPDELLKLEEC